MKNKKKKCGCKHEAIREMLGSKSCYDNMSSGKGIFEAHNFQKNKKFKVTFNEDVDVVWNQKELLEKKLTDKDKKQKSKRAEELKPHMKEFTKRYGKKKGKKVLFGVADKYAKKTK